MKLTILAGVIALVLANEANAGSLVDYEVASQALKQNMPVTVYVPDGRPPINGWPVLYLLHGYQGNQHSWRDLGKIQQSVDRLIASGSIKPLLIIMPGVGNSWYVDSAAVGGPGDFETALTRDLKQWVETKLPARKDMEGRAIAGVSMGGYGALHLAYAYPDLYCAVASLSGAIWQNIPPEDTGKSPDQLKALQDQAFFRHVDATTITSGVVLLSTGDHYSGSFSTPFKADLFNKNNVFTLVAKQTAVGEALPATYLSVGDADVYQLWRGAIALRETLLADGINASLRITDGDHVWSLWQKSIVEALKFIDGHWNRAPS